MGLLNASLTNMGQIVSSLGSIEDPSEMKIQRKQVLAPTPKIWGFGRTFVLTAAPPHDSFVLSYLGGLVEQSELSNFSSLAFGRFANAEELQPDHLLEKGGFRTHKLEPAKKDEIIQDSVFS